MNHVKRQVTQLADVCTSASKATAFHVPLWLDGFCL